MKLSRKITAVAIAVTAAGVIAAGTAVAATTASAPPQATRGCVGAGRALAGVYENASSFPGCPAGAFAVSLSGTGATGATGPQGATGATGAQGPSGVVSVASDDLGGVASVPTGGSFVTGATLTGTVTLRAGTYELSVNAKATPLTSSAIEVFPQFFVYDQAANADFAGDLLNVGSGALASSSTTIDSYYSGSGVITLASDTTLDLYAFGYDSDRGAGSYALDDLSVTAVRLQAAG